MIPGDENYFYDKELSNFIKDDDQGFGSNMKADIIYYSKKDKKRNIMDQLISLGLTQHEQILVTLCQFVKDRERSTQKVQKFISLNNPDHPTWNYVVSTFVNHFIIMLEREINKSIPITYDHQIFSIEDFIKQHIINHWNHYHEEDIIEIVGNDRKIVYVNYIVKRMSPNYDEIYKNEVWRNTQFMFELVFHSGLFLWLYANVVESFQKKRVGTSFIECVEMMARDIGFRRFCVDKGNRMYWENILHYDQLIMGRTYSETDSFMWEGYKEM